MRLLSAVSLTAASALAQGGANPQVLITIGEPAPGLSGVTIANVGNGLDEPILDQNGTVLFRARLAGAVTPADDRAYLIGRSRGDLRVAVRAGDQAPGLAAGTLLRSSSATTGSAGLNSSPRISPVGETLFFQSALYDPAYPSNTPSTADTALFWGPVGSLQCLAREGDPIPFLPAGTWGNLTATLQSTQINASGQVVFMTSAVGVPTASDGLLVTGSPGALTVVAREGDVLPGGEVLAPITGSAQLAFSPQINESGQVLHDLRFSTTAPSTATSANDLAIAVWTPGVGDVLIAREGQPAPGTNGATFGNASGTWSPMVNGARFTRSGQTAFHSALIGGDVIPGVNDWAIFHGGIGGLTMVARRGSACPGLADGEAFAGVSTAGITCNDIGDVAFVATLAGPTVDSTNDTSLWIARDGNLAMIAREGAMVVGPGLLANIGQLDNATCVVLLSDRGDAFVRLPVDDGTDVPLHVWFDLLRANWDNFALWMDIMCAGPDGVEVFMAMGSNGGDGGPSHFTGAGDFCARYVSHSVPTSIVRGHVGRLQASPAAVPAAGGVPQAFAIDCGPAHAGSLYWVVASGSGTRPGFLSPLGPQTIPLNLDGWTSLSLQLANTAVYSNTLGLLDANGRANASFSLPPGVAGLAGTTLHHAVVVLDLLTFASTFVSEPVSVLLY
ncbi:MAG: hypothetical protein K8J09_12375 [Planctomycetes bacterium]|nr:hypothetical protein [Planctomycetota bacterium]